MYTVGPSPFFNSPDHAVADPLRMPGVFADVLGNRVSQSAEFAGNKSRGFFFVMGKLGRSVQRLVSGKKRRHFAVEQPIQLGLLTACGRAIKNRQAKAETGNSVARRLTESSPLADHGSSPLATRGFSGIAAEKQALRQYPGSWRAALSTEVTEAGFAAARPKLHHRTHLTNPAQLRQSGRILPAPAAAGRAGNSLHS